MLEKQVLSPPFSIEIVKLIRIISVFVFLLFSAQAWSQKETVKDTITIMHYNLLYYGQTSNQCTSSNNPIGDKDIFLERIIRYVDPDILSVNEMGCSSLLTARILSKCLNVGTDKYYRTSVQNRGGQNLCNALFYNNDKLGLIQSGQISQGRTGINFIRTIDIHDLFVRGDYLEQGGDTIYLSQLVAHLKAGSTSNDANERDYAADGIMYYLEQNRSAGNYILGGDLNVYRNTEGGFNNLVNYSDTSLRFNDPVNQIGRWTNNSAYAKYHTQSTRSSQTNGGCFSGGGMDDRFDFLLASNDLISGNKKVRYIPDSYKTLGQDGLRFNSDLLTPNNSSAPSSIVSALYNMSDHLPVILQLEVEYEVFTGQNENSLVHDVKWIENDQNGLNFLIEMVNPMPVDYAIYELSGQIIDEGILNLDEGSHFYHIDFEHKGLFIIKFELANGDQQTLKVVR